MQTIDISTLYELKRQIDMRLQYQIMLRKSYESKIGRVEPLSDEFEEAMTGIFKAQDEINRLGSEKVNIQYEIGIYDYKNRQ